MALKDFDEQFENASGYDESGWTESGTVDPNKATSGVTGAPADWDDECLEVNVTAAAASIMKEFTAYSTFYCRVELILDSFGSTNQRIFESKSGGNFCWYLELRSGPVLRMLFDNGSQAGNDESISEDQRYRIEVKYVNGGECEWKIDGTSKGTHASGDYTVDDIRIGVMAAATHHIYFDNVAYGDAGWIGAESEGGGSAVPLIMQQRRQQVRRRRSGLFAIQMPGWIRRESGLLVKA